MIHELEKMCLQQDFDQAGAIEIIKQIDLNQTFIPSEYACETYLLNWAATQANISMVELLLKNGADPNQIFDDDATLWNLQYNDGETDEENERRLKIAQLLLEYGADPLITPDQNDENLFDYVVWAVFNDTIDGLWEYRSRFLILLVAYGAKTEYCSPRIVGTFDKMDMQQYKFFFVPESDNRYSGVIIDGQEQVVAYV